MIREGDIIKADEGKVLYCTYTHQVWGKSVRLGTLFEHKLLGDDFIEVDDSGYEVIDGVYYDFNGKSYDCIKRLIIQLHYSIDDQIAIMLNNDDDKMREMQEWREFAKNIAKKYVNK